MRLPTSNRQLLPPGSIGRTYYLLTLVPVAITLCVVSLVFFNAPGTPDVVFWFYWM